MPPRKGEEFGTRKKLFLSLSLGHSDPFKFTYECIAITAIFSQLMSEIYLVAIL